MKIVLLDAKTLGDDIDLSVFGRLGEVNIYETSTAKQAAERLLDADVAILNKVKIDQNILCSAKNLKLICVTATGFDNIDLAYAKSRNIAVCNVKGYSTDSVALVTVSLALSLACRLNYYDKYCKSGLYTASGVHNCLKPVFYELSGKVWGIYGYGSIGKKVAEAAKALGCKIIVNKRVPVDDVTCVDLDSLFEKSDIISVHTPLTDLTYKSINAERLSKMKPNSILINTSRGAVTDEKAVVSAIESGILSGFATDVYDGEPMSADSPYNRILDRDNVIFTPHMAWGAYESRTRLVSEVCENIRDFFSNGLRNRIDLRAINN